MLFRSLRVRTGVLAREHEALKGRASSLCPWLPPSLLHEASGLLALSHTGRHKALPGHWSLPFRPLGALLSRPPPSGLTLSPVLGFYFDITSWTSENTPPGPLPPHSGGCIGFWTPYLSTLWHCPLAVRSLFPGGKLGCPWWWGCHSCPQQLSVRGDQLGEAGEAG